MAESLKLKIFNDPIYGFIGVPNEFIFKLIGHPYFQRLRRIAQMGMSYLVYPGAHHTRFHHALGSMHLMQKAVAVLRYKNVKLSLEEENALLTAILLHDIGHGPFSHALEGKIAHGYTHEAISLGFMKALHEEFGGKMEMAISIFEGKHPRSFMNQLVSSQLDMDRLDYLKRDSFYTGVTEGNINSERLITMLNVVDGGLVVEEKGIYAVEKFLMARRFMYWQAYLHKTSLVAELLLLKIMERAKVLLKKGTVISCSVDLKHFLQCDTKVPLTPALLEDFARLDDVDIVSALKQWQFHEDNILSRLSRMVLNRSLLKIKMRNKPITEEKLIERRKWVVENYNLDDDQSHYFVFTGKVNNQAYSNEQHNINILRKNGKITDVAKASDHFGLHGFSKTVTKYYACYPKESVR